MHCVKHFTCTGSGEILSKVVYENIPRRWHVHNARLDISPGFPDQQEVQCGLPVDQEKPHTHTPININGAEVESMAS